MNTNIELKNLEEYMFSNMESCGICQTSLEKYNLFSYLLLFTNTINNFNDISDISSISYMDFCINNKAVAKNLLLSPIFNFELDCICGNMIFLKSFTINVYIYFSFKTRENIEKVLRYISLLRKNKHFNERRRKINDQ